MPLTDPLPPSAATAPRFDDEAHGARSGDRVAELVRAAWAAAQDEGATAAERAEMLMEVAMGVQQQPKTMDHLHAAVRLYDEALAICPAEEPLLAARATARRGTALQAFPGEGMASLEAARASYERAIPVLRELGAPAETAEAEMNLGLVLQQLAAGGHARISDAIAAYQRSLRTFDARAYPVEFSILQNNLATAFLTVPLTDERANIREALAVQCFEEALQVVSRIDHPAEYAMLQNNLGNALQYASSSHALENNLRAIAAYDEALQVRTRANAPLEYANTIANKANCLWNLPDDPQRPDRGNDRNLRSARACYQEARDIFATHGALEKAQRVSEALAELESQIAAAPRDG